MATNHDRTPPVQPTVVAVVLNWHTPSQTERCLRSLRNLQYNALRIVLVDNGCSDFSATTFPNTPPTDYIQSPVNLGFAGGCNLGMQSALKTGADYVWFVNSDAEVEPTSLTTMVDAAEGNRAIAALGPKVLQRAEPNRIDSLALRINLSSGRFRLIGHDEIDRGQFDHLHTVSAVTGCAMLVRAEPLRLSGGFDERYFLYLEDVDLCLRLSAAGHQIACVPRARVQHDRPSTGQGRQSLPSLYYTARNHFLLLAKHGKGNAAHHLLRNTGILLWNIAFASRGNPVEAPRRVAAVLAGALDYQRGRLGQRPD